MIPFAVSLGLAGLLLVSAVALALGRIDFPAPGSFALSSSTPKRSPLLSPSAWWSAW